MIISFGPDNELNNLNMR